MPSFGHRVVHHEETGSTMNDARALAAEGAAEGTVVRADRQTAGRGRLGRTWVSPGGGLWFSVVLRPGIPAERWGLLPLVFGGAVARALRERGVPAEVKWPNDVLVEGRKVAGLLLEARFAGAERPAAIVGVGLNARVPAAELPDEVRGTATTLEDAVGEDLDALFQDLLEAMDADYRRVQSGDVAAVLQEYRSISCTLGRRVRVDGHEGLAVDVREEDGALLVEEASGQRVFVTAGGVVGEED